MAISKCFIIVVLPISSVLCLLNFLIDFLSSPPSSLFLPLMLLKLCKSRLVVLKNIPPYEFVYFFFFQCHLTNFYLSLINEVSCESGWGLGSGFLFLLQQHFIGKAVCHVTSHYVTFQDHSDCLFHLQWC